MTVQDLISRSLTLAGRLGQGRTPGTSESAVAFTALNAMLNSWSTDRRTVFTVQPSTWPLTAGKNFYQIGPAATDFVAPRPVMISSATIVATLEGISRPFPLKLADQVDWAGLPDRGDSSVIPQVLFNDGAFPASMLWLHPIPATATHLELWTWQALAQFVALTDLVAFPVGYERAVVYNLAIEIAALFALAIPDSVIAIAKVAKDNIDAINAKLPPPGDVPAPKA